MLRERRRLAETLSDRSKWSRYVMNVETGAELRLLIEDMVEPALERLFLLSHDFLELVYGIE